MKIFDLKKFIGKGVKRTQISKVLWPNSSKKTQEVLIGNLINGKRKYIKVSWVVNICDMLNIDPNTLFGYPWRKKVVIKKKKTDGTN